LYRRFWEARVTIAFNQTTVAAEPAGSGVVRQRLLTDERMTGSNVLLERLTLEAGSTIRLEPSTRSLIWFHLLAGEARLDTLYTNQMSDTHSAFLPPGFVGSLSTGAGATLLYAEVLNGGERDPASSDILPRLMVINWTREPVFKSERDARKRVALVTDKTCSTKAIRIEMVIYPPASMSASYHHEGAASFMYVLSGRGTASANEQPFSLQQGDLIYFPDRERHSVKAADDSEMRFLAFYVPGELKTVWADPGKASAWRSTGLDINGYETLDDQKERRNRRAAITFG
jgi:quercetin dioxygenase-like cupin family protein